MPRTVIRSAVAFMDIQQSDVMIDPACGTGGFLFESYRQLREKYPDMKDGNAKAWAQRHLYGIDKDRINVKLTKALMLIIGDGSTHTYVADALRVSRWPEAYPELVTVKDEQFSCVITNPPFGQNLTFSALEGAKEKYEVSRKPAKRSEAETEYQVGKYEEREIGIVFLERCFRLLRPGGKLGIILPETYMFSPSYAWLHGWLKKNFEVLGMLNIPMEAFQGFCRAKTNFYVLRKVGAKGSTTPGWHRPYTVLSINALTCGINKDGHEQYIVNPKTGLRTETLDDQLWDAVGAVKRGEKLKKHTRYLPTKESDKENILVPSYFDDAYDKEFDQFIAKNDEFEGVTLGELKSKGWIMLSGGHGSPSTDQRVGTVPYIKVSDLRAGLVNINPINLVPVALAKTYWKRPNQKLEDALSGLVSYDLISPERASKNIGEFCVLLPGQENILLTKEVIIVRAQKAAPFDQFFLMWALSLRCSPPVAKDCLHANQP